MRIAVFGTGGVGGYFGARLAQAGEDVVFIARGEHLHAMRSPACRQHPRASFAGDANSAVTPVDGEARQPLGALDNSRPPSTQN
jgi:ketopantoate reductase